ncbi:MAG: TetR/AcrR family transcriptional regulator [Prevotellaceae bacterium]|jgi:AcrR family transcriptional regulator|nr:TetR/AcrR family transcriptional regulator [Prevotellaceae bacterium]
MELKQQILKFSEKLFLEFGIKRVSIDDICNDLHISKKTFYTVFKGKDEVIKDILSDIREENEKQKLIDDENENIIDIILTKTNMVKQKSDKKKFNFFYDMKKYYPKIFENHRVATRKSALKLIEKMLKRGIEQGVFRENINMELMPFFIYDMFAKLPEYIEQKKATWIVLTDCFIDTILRMICNEKGMKYYLKTKN